MGSNLEFFDPASSPNLSGTTWGDASGVSPSPRVSGDDSSLLGEVTGAIRRAKHPMAATFHLIFKALALFVYTFATFFSSNYVFIFVICILLLAFDFWTVKNVTGRLLVGLRWWNRIKPDGSNEWIFESLEDMSDIGTNDSRIFWIGLYGAPFFWILLFIISLLKLQLQWLLIILVALTLSGANIIGYTKCKKDAKEKIQGFVSKSALGALGSSAGSSLMSFAFGNSKNQTNGSSSSVPV